MNLSFLKLYICTAKTKYKRYFLYDLKLRMLSTSFGPQYIPGIPPQIHLKPLNDRKVYSTYIVIIHVLNFILTKKVNVMSECVSFYFSHLLNQHLCFKPLSSFCTGIIYVVIILYLLLISKV